MSRQDEAASSSDSRRRSLRPLETARFTGSPYVTSPSAFSPPDTSHPGTTFELIHLARGINGLPPARHATKRQESIPSVPEVKDERKNAVYHHVEVAPGSTSLTDTMPSIVEGVRGNGADKAAGSSAVSGEDKVKQPLPPKTVHDPYVMSQWAELHKMDESRGRKSTGGVIDLSSSQSGGNQSEEPDIPTMMHARLRNILDLQMEISDMHLRLEDVDHNGQLGGTLTCPKNESMPQAGSPENKDDKMSFDGLQKREDGVMALFDKIETLSSVIRSFHAIPHPSLAFPFESSTPTGTNPPTATSTATAPSPFLQPPRASPSASMLDHKMPGSLPTWKDPT